MTSVRLSENINNRLDELAHMTKRSKSSFIQEALEKYLMDMEDAYIALSRITDSKTKYVSSDELFTQLEAEQD